MESFSLLKYWRSTTSTTTSTSRATTPNTILSAVSPLSSSDEDEEGPYFDLQFSLQDDNETDETEESLSLNEEQEQEQAEELKLTVESNEEEEEEEQNVKISASDELFFKENLVSIEENSNKAPVSLLKSATKFRVLLLKLKKSKSGNEKPLNKTEDGKNQQQGKSKFFTVKLKVEEVKAPIVSYFTRDNSSKLLHQKPSCKDLVKNQTEDSQDEKLKLAKEVVQKYLNLVKKRYVEKKLKFSGGRNGGDVSVSPPCGVEAEKPGEAEVTSCVRTNLKQGNSNLQAGLKVVKKHLVKSRSASATVPPPVVSDRRDDSLLQVQDGIQGAIMHCKRSFNGSRDGEGGSTMLSRSVSDQSYDKSQVMMGTVSSAAASSCPGEPKDMIKV